MIFLHPTTCSSFQIPGACCHSVLIVNHIIDNNQLRIDIAHPPIKHSPLPGDQRPLAHNEARAARRALLVVLEVHLVGHVRGHGAVARQRGHDDAVLELDGATTELQRREKRRKFIRRGRHAVRGSGRLKGEWVVVVVVVLLSRREIVIAMVRCHSLYLYLLDDQHARIRSSVLFYLGNGMRVPRLLLIVPDWTRA